MAWKDPERGGREPIVSGKTVPLPIREAIYDVEKKEKKVESGEEGTADEDR